MSGASATASSEALAADLDVALERAKILNHLVWDVLIKGDPNSDEYKALEKEIRAAGAPGPLSLLIHNERVTWTPHAPQIADAGGFDLLHRVNRQQIADGTGFPPHRLNDGNTVNAQADLLSVANVTTLTGSNEADGSAADNSFHDDQHPTSRHA